VDRRWRCHPESGHRVPPRVQPEAAHFAPALLRHQRQLEDQAQQGVPGRAVLGPGGAVPNGGKTRFDRISSPNMDPVLGRKVVKGQQLGSIFGQDDDRFGILGAKISHEAIKRFFRLGLSSAIQISCNPTLALP